MSKRSKRPDYSWWETQIKAGINFRKKYTHEERWPDWRAYYRGNWKSDILPVNYFFSILRALVPRVYFRNPSVSVTPAMPGMLAAVFAQILERIDNKLIRSMGVKKHIKKMIQDAFLFGAGFGKLGFGAQFTPSPSSVITTAPINQRWGSVEYRSGLRPNMPWFSRVPTGQIIVPDQCEDLEDARWICHEVERPFRDVRDDPRFKTGKDLKPTRIESTSAGRIERPIEMIKLWEVRDRKFQKVYVFAADQQVVLYDGPDELQTFQGFPIFDLVFNNDDEVFWGVPDSVIIEPQQLEANETRTQIMLHRRLTVVKILYESGAISKRELNKMISENVLAGVEVKDINKVKPVQASTIPRELFVNADATAGDIREMVGFSRNQMGDLDQKKSERTTATEASIVQMASEIRVNERQDIVADLLERVIHSMHEVIMKFWQKDQVIDLIGPGGIPVWVEFSGKMLRGGAYEVHVDADSSVPQTRRVREAKAIQAYSLLKENPLVDPIKLTKYLLRELHGVQYDDMMRGLPIGAGQNFPMTVPQFGQLMQNANRLGLPVPTRVQKGGVNSASPA